MRNLLLNDPVGGKVGGYKSITGVNSSWFSSYPFALDTSCEIKKKFQMNLNLHLDKLLLIYGGGDHRCSPVCHLSQVSDI